MRVGVSGGDGGGECKREDGGKGEGEAKDGGKAKDGGEGIRLGYVGFRLGCTQHIHTR